MKALLIAFLLALSAHYISAKAIVPKSSFNDDDAEVISCDYFGSGVQDDEYVCLLTLRNPDGVEFTSIAGDHQSGFGDDDVEVVSAFYQNSPIVPSVLCRQFPNLWSLTIASSNIADLTPAAFADCSNLQQLILQGNIISSLPDNLLSNSANLVSVDFGYNVISSIAANAFTGTAIQNLELAFNQLDEINNNWFTPISSTLIVLDLMSNGISTITGDAFNNLATLEQLLLNFNALTSIDANAFNGLTSLESLSLSSTSISELNPAWFSTLSSLRTFAATNNQIRELPDNVFSALGSLVDLFLYGNRIRDITFAAFGTLGTSNLHTVYLSDNLVNNIDIEWLVNANSLEYLLLADNLCIDQDFLNVQNIQWRIFEQLMRCTENFAMEPQLSCHYNELMDGGYACSLFIHNPNAFDEFEAIDGDHLAGRNNEDVTTLTAFYQNTRIIPSILCATFPNLQVVFVMQSNLEDLREASFADCANLEVLYLHDNWINAVPDFTFRNNPNLRQLELGMNWIETLSENSFAGSAIENLDIDANRLSELRQEWFGPINETLVTLDAVGNIIGTLGDDAFSNLRNLRFLIIGNNPFNSIPATAFQSLTNLELLTLDRTGILELNPSWFIGLTNLEAMYIQNNGITEFADGIFNSLTALTRVLFENNFVMELSAAAFGNSLANIGQLFGQNNRLRSFDPAIFDGAPNLQWLLLDRNICTQGDFSNVQGDLENVMSRLSICFGNFGSDEISCNYSESDGFYTCSLNIHNPLGRNAFESIGGNHLPDRTDADVTGIYVQDGNTLNIPSILCSQFPNLVEMDFINDRIEFLDADSFSGCGSLRSLMVYNNLLTSIPWGIFDNTPNLETVSFGRNQLTSLSIPSNTFVGTAISFLDLSNNPLVDFNDNWVRPISQTLTTLDILGTRVSNLWPTAFDSLNNLQTLVLAENPLNDLPVNIFARLESLSFLAMGGCQFRNINPAWFAGLTRLETLQIYNNRILDLPTNALNSLDNLQTLYVYSNNLRELRVDSFGAAITSIRAIYATYNQITAIDPDFINRATNISYIYAYGNECTQDNFYEIDENRDAVNEQLAGCYANFAAESINCNYMLNEENNYACMMEVFNPIGRDGFESISGNHLPGFTDNSVLQVDVLFQNTRIVPAIICSQFPSTREIIIFGSLLDVLTERSFAECTDLTHLIMFDNTLFEIPDFVFVNNRNLRYLEIGMNRIERLSANSFSGSAIEFLDISSNYLTSYEPAWFASINSTLHTLDLIFNSISQVPPDAFRQLRGLNTLVLNANPLNNLPPNVFEGSDNLEFLFMSNCSLSMLNSQWFRTLRSLTFLQINNNGFTILPSGIFNSLTSLRTLQMSNNFIWELNSQIFGNSIASITAIDASNNIVNLIDSSFITSATSLDILQLNGNVCSDQNFADVANYLWVTLEYLSECTSNFVLEEQLSCSYGDITPTQYTCTLTAFNPRGFDGFGQVDGNHLQDRANDNVVMVYANNQEMRILPSIVCHQFSNLEEVVIFNSNLLEVTSATFAECSNLRMVFINGNLLRILPDNLFSRSPSMEIISFASNRISEIASNAFNRTALSLIDLGFNRLSTFNSAAFAAVNETLNVLDLVGNQLAFFPFDAFDGARNILELYLNYNPLTNIYSGTFAPLVNLQLLSMAGCQLADLSPVMFYNLVNVHTLYLQNNNIEVLPDGAFHNMTSLETLYIYENNIHELNAAHFGGSLSSIRIINAPSNQINLIDPDILDSAPNLNYWRLSDNICTNEDFLGIQDNIESVRQGLRTCFDNFQLEPEIGCDYQETILDEYACFLNIHNPNGVEFSVVPGEHLTGRSDADVQLITVYLQNSRNLPSIVCSTFNDIREIIVMSSNLMVVTPATFESCATLEQIYLNDNRITQIPANTFANSPNLRLIGLSTNRIATLNVNSFAGTAVAFLDLGDNRLTSLNSAWFEPINGTLTTLDLIANSISTLGSDLFRNLRNIETLALNVNPLSSVADDAFASLGNLHILAIGNCYIRELSAAWFSGLSTLSRLYLFSNGIRELPEGVFNGLNSLDYLDLTSNGLSEIALASFGSSAAAISNLQLANNLINAIDPAFFDAATNLDSLYLGGNFCANENFVEIRNRLDDVRNNLETCFANFS